MQEACPHRRSLGSRATLEASTLNYTSQARGWLSAPQDRSFIKVYLQRWHRSGKADLPLPNSPKTECFESQLTGRAGTMLQVLSNMVNLLLWLPGAWDQGVWGSWSLFVLIRGIHLAWGRCQHQQVSVSGEDSASPNNPWKYRDTSQMPFPWWHGGHNDSVCLWLITHSLSLCRHTHL